MIDTTTTHAKESSFIMLVVDSKLSHYYMYIGTFALNIPCFLHSPCSECFFPPSSIEEQRFGFPPSSIEEQHFGTYVSGLLHDLANNTPDQFS